MAENWTICVKVRGTESCLAPHRYMKSDSVTQFKGKKHKNVSEQGESCVSICFCAFRQLPVNWHQQPPAVVPR